MVLPWPRSRRAEAISQRSSRAVPRAARSPSTSSTDSDDGQRLPGPGSCQGRAERVELDQSLPPGPTPATGCYGVCWSVSAVDGGAITGTVAMSTPGPIRARGLYRSRMRTYASLACSPAAEGYGAPDPRIPQQTRRIAPSARTGPLETVGGLGPRSADRLRLIADP